MPNLLESNVLIVPLSLFIKNNEKNTLEKFKTIFRSMTDHLFSNPEESVNHAYFKKQLQQFNEKSLKKILNSSLVTDFNLGKKNKDQFILELSSALKLHPSDSRKVMLEEAWNSLIEFDHELDSVFDSLIKLTYQGKSIYFIEETNELHAQKSLEIFSLFPFHNLSFLENLPNPTASPLLISYLDSTHDTLTSPKGSVYFCLSYAYQTFLTPSSNFLSQFFRFKSTPDLLTHLIQHLNAIGKRKDTILFVSANLKEQSLAEKLALETISKEAFYTELSSSAANKTTVRFDDPNRDKTQPIASKSSLQKATSIECGLSVNPKAH
jgi:hypothetical protein